jgi:ribosome-binding protein aMBF1 (putative translation factor)
MMEKNNRISEALSIRGMKQIELAEKTSIRKSSINSWVKQRWQPKQEALYKMAKILDVSEMWLAGYDAPMEKPLEQHKMEELAEVIKLIRKDERLAQLVTNLSKLKKDQLSTVEIIVAELVKANS